MITIDETLDVAAPPEAVFRVITRLERYPSWIPGVSSATPLAGAPEGTPGSRFQLRFAGPMGPLDADGDVTAAEPPRSLEIRGTSGLFALTAACRVEAVDAGSRLRVSAGLELKGLARFLEGQVRGKVASGMDAALAELRTAIEAEASRPEG